MNSEKAHSSELDLRLILEQKNNYSIKQRSTLLVKPEPCDLARGLMGVGHFEDFQRFLGIPRAVMSERLEKLVEYGILKKTPYKEPGGEHTTNTNPPKPGSDCSRC